MTQNTQYDFAAYLQRFKQQSTSLLGKHVKGYTAYEHAVATTWAITIQRLSAPARAVMRLSSFLADTPIPLGLFRADVEAVKSIATAFPDVTPADLALDDEGYVNDAANDLHRYSMAMQEGDSLRFHKLVQKVERDGLQPSIRDTSISTAIVVVSKYAPGNAHEPEAWPIWQVLLAHAAALADKHGGVDKASEPIAEVLNGLSCYCFGMGWYERSLAYVQRWLSVVERLHGHETEAYSDSLINVGESLRVCGRVQEAVDLFQRAVVFDRASPSRRRHLATSLNYLGIAQTDLQQLADAKVSYTEGLRVSEETPDRNERNHWKLKYNLAAMLRDEGEPAKAEPLFQEALMLARTLCEGKDHPQHALAIYGLASAKYALGEKADAMPLFEQSMEMYQRLFKGDHPDVATILNNVAGVKVSLGRAAEAEPLYQHALEMNQRLFKGDHPNVATSLNNLAGVMESLGRAAEAEPLYQQALEMRQRLFKGDHQNLATSLENLALVKQSLGRAAEAEPLFQQAAEMYQRLFKGDHQSVAISLNNLASAKQSLGRAAEAEPLYQQALEMRQRLFRGDHRDVAISLNNLANVKRSLGRAAEAEPLYQQALEMCQRLFKGDHPDVASGLKSLAGVQESTGRAAEAEPLYQQALEMRERLGHGQSPDFVLALNNYAILLRKLGRFTKAAEYFARAIAIEDATLPPGHPKRAHRRNNLGLVRLLDGDLPGADAATREAWTLKGADHDVSSGRILFVRTALSLLRDESAAIYLGQLRTLLTIPNLSILGDINRLWECEDVLDTLAERLPTYAGLFRALVAALNDQSQLEALDNQPLCRDAPPVPLDAPWPAATSSRRT